MMYFKCSYIHLLNLYTFRDQPITMKLVSHTTAIQKIKSAHCFVAVYGVGLWCSVFSKVAHAVVRRTFHVVSTETAVTMAVPIESPADCEVLFVFYRRENYQVRSRVEIVLLHDNARRILLGRHKPYCVSNSIRTSSSILRIIRTWHRWTFSCFQK